MTTERLSKMKFTAGTRTFTWPHNPTVYNQGLSKNLIQHKYVDINGARHEDTGHEPRVISGSGEFFGPDAYSQYIRLEGFFLYRIPGKLYHPKWGTISARFTKLSTKEEPTPNYVSYDFEFVEESTITVIKIIPKPKPTTTKPKPTSTKGKRYYVVKKNDKLWNIAVKYYGKGTLWKKIADANKKIIKDPDVIHAGWKLEIPY